MLGHEEFSIINILSLRGVNPVFQPIVDFRGSSFLGFEGLIRGPYGSYLQSPERLLQEARLQGLGDDIEVLCLEVLLDQYAELQVPGRLFLNISPGMLTHPYLLEGMFFNRLSGLNISPARIVLELTENQQLTDSPDVLDAISHYRLQGLQFAIDDLGEGFSNLRMWSDLRPEFVKIDKHFIKGIARDRIKYHFVRAMQDLAEICRATLIAEGVECEEDLLCVRDMGIACCQGFLIAKAVANPDERPEQHLLSLLSKPRQMHHGLMASGVEMPICAVRYANPLTQLPGNVPTNEHIDNLLLNQHRFVAAYVDIDNFKPFNDNYGYRRGDDVIQSLGQLIVECTDSKQDFVGHIGGDDFFVVFQSTDWELQCLNIIRRFGESMAALVGQEAHARGGYMAENRKGEVVFQPLPTLSIGAVRIFSGQFESHREVSSAAAVAKKQAKKQAKKAQKMGRYGNHGSLFMERRGEPGSLNVAGEMPRYLN